MRKSRKFSGLIILFLLILFLPLQSAKAQAKGAWVEYQLPFEMPANWARMVGENCLLYVDRDQPVVYAFDVNGGEWHTYTAATSLQWDSQIKVGRNVAMVFNDEMVVAYTGLSQQFVPLTYSGTMLSPTTYGHDCKADMAYIVTDQHFYVFDGEDAVWRSYDISGFGTISSWGVYGIEDYAYLYLNAADDSKKIVAFSYITKTFANYDGEGYVEHDELQHGFVFFKNMNPADSTTHFFAGYTAASGDYVMQMSPNNYESWNTMAVRGKPGTTYFFAKNVKIVDNDWRHDMWGFDTRFGDFVYSNFNYDYACGLGITTYGAQAGSSVAVDSYRDCVTGELYYIVYKGDSNSFQTVLEEGLYYPTCGTSATPQCGGEIIGASDCDYIWFFDTDTWLGHKMALPEAVDGYTNPAGMVLYDTWGIGECRRALSDEVYLYSYNKTGNSLQSQQVGCHTISGRMDSTNIGGFYAPYISGDTILAMYSPGTDTWLLKNFSTEGTAWGRGIQRDFIYYYDYGGSGPLQLFDGVTGELISLPLGWGYAATASSHLYTRSNFMITYSADNRYSGYSTYTRTHSEYAGEYLSSWNGQEDVVVMSKTISGGGIDILAYNVLYDDFVMTSLGTEYGTYFNFWYGGKTALIMTTPGHLIAWDPYADAVMDADENTSDGQLPENIELAQNYPNPFNPSTVIEYLLPRRSPVTISIYNLLGQKVSTIVDETQEAGSYSVSWDGTDNNGRAAASGMYFYRIQAGDFIDSKKMLMLK